MAAKRAVLVGAFSKIESGTICINCKKEGGFRKKSKAAFAFLKILLLSEKEYTKMVINKSGKTA